jgi:hypothetical protein
MLVDLAELGVPLFLTQSKIVCQASSPIILLAVERTRILKSIVNVGAYWTRLVDLAELSARSFKFTKVKIVVLVSYKLIQRMINKKVKKFLIKLSTFSLLKNKICYVNLNRQIKKKFLFNHLKNG